MGFWQGKWLCFLQDYVFLHGCVWAWPQVGLSRVSDSTAVTALLCEGWTEHSEPVSHSGCSRQPY